MRTYLYIACCGHSGSTLLEKLLATAPGVVAMGEVCHFSHYFDHPSKPCGCGMTVNACPFWRAVVARLGVAEGVRLDRVMPTDGFRSAPLANLPHFASLLLPGAAGSLAAQGSGEVGARSQVSVANHWRVVQAVADESSATVLVDKSMSASRLLEVAAAAPGGYRLGAIHLVRDGRATVHSHRVLFERSTVASARIWRRTNLHVELALRRLRAVPQLRVRYEDLCNEPQRALETIAQRFGLSAAFDPARLSTPTHAIGGNRAKLTGYAEITLDERWKTELAPQEHARFRRAAGWLNRRYGYERD